MAAHAKKARKPRSPKHHWQQDHRGAVCTRCETRLCVRTGKTGSAIVTFVIPAHRRPQGLLLVIGGSGHAPPCTAVEAA